jgi:hypothetical protein
MQGFRNYGMDALNMQQDLLPHQYSKSTPPPSPPAGKFKCFSYVIDKESLMTL